MFEIKKTLLKEEERVLYQFMLIIHIVILFRHTNLTNLLQAQEHPRGGEAG